MSEKLDCVCRHEYSDAHLTLNGSETYCIQCDCTQYDPAGHNPEIENIICPRCRLTWMNLLDERTYFCYACQYILLEKQVKELVNKND